MSKDKDPKLNYHEEENSMVTDFEDLKELGKKWNKSLIKMIKKKILKKTVSKVL